MKIRYGINRAVRVKKRKFIEHQNHEMKVDGRWRYSKIVEAIKAKHPGWGVSGYCSPASPSSP